MDGTVRSGRTGGRLLAAGGVGFLLAGALHPQPPAELDAFEEAMTAMLSHPFWPASHWIALVTGLILVWAVWLLVDEGWGAESPVARAGARLAIVSTLFMSVQWAVEIAARGAVDAYAVGEAVPLVDLIDAMQAVGWPALGLGFGLLAAGLPGSAPRWVVVLGVVGAVSVGLAGLLAQGLHIREAGVLFLGGNLLALWMVWSGLRLGGGGGAIATGAGARASAGDAAPRR